MGRMLLFLTSVAVVCSSALAEGRNSLQLALAVDAKEYCLGQPVFMVVTLRNTGTKVIKAQLGNTLEDDFDLEMAFGKEPFTKAHFRLVMHLRTPTPFRDFKPAEVLGASTALLLKSGGEAPPIRLLKKKKVALSQWLLFGRPGSYRLRAAANIRLKDRTVRVHSKEIFFKVTPKAKGYEHFVRFAIKYCRNESLRLNGKSGFTEAHVLLPKLEKTVYARYVDWMMLGYYLEYIAEDEKEDRLSDKVKAQRARLRKCAEGVVAVPPKKWTLREEQALMFLVLYHWQANETAKAMKHADVLQNLPWSRHADLAVRLERELKKAERAKSTTKAERPVIDVAKPDTWEVSVKRANKNITNIARTLISVAKDEKRATEERRKAILLLGEIRNKESLDFLISNVSLRIPVFHSQRLPLETPYKYALCKRDWNIAKAVLNSMVAKEKSKTDLLNLSSVLVVNLTRNLAIAIVNEELRKLRGSENVYKKNLKIVRTYLKS